MAQPIIRKGIISDAKAVHHMIHQLATYEKAPLEHTCTLEQFIADGFGPKPAYNLLVAELEHKVVGMMLYFDHYSTWKGKSIYLDDFVVDQQHRQHGIGKMLFDALLIICQEKQVNRLMWQVLDWNLPAINFYNKIGAQLDPEWINGKFSKEEIALYKFG
jgi:GNAT superfamily N-acetyltransferase